MEFPLPNAPEAPEYGPSEEIDGSEGFKVGLGFEPILNIHEDPLLICLGLDPRIP